MHDAATAPVIDPTQIQSATALPGVAMPVEVQHAPMTSLLPPIEHTDSPVAPVTVGIVGPDAPPDPLPADKLAEPLPEKVDPSLIGEKGAKLEPTPIADKGTELDPTPIADKGTELEPTPIADKGTELDPRIAEEKGTEPDPRIAEEKGTEPDPSIAEEKGAEPELAGGGIIGPDQPVDAPTPETTAPEPGAGEIVGPDQPIATTDPDGSRHVRVFDPTGNLTNETVYASNGDVGQMTFNSDGTITYSGTLAGDELKLTRVVGQFGTEQLSAKRASASPAK